MAQMTKRKFIIKYGLMYAACLTFSLGLGFVLAAAMNGGGELWKVAVFAVPAIIVVALLVGWLLAAGVNRRNFAPKAPESGKSNSDKAE